jgi:NADH-quinone oxidoreductase subunit J
MMEFVLFFLTAAIALIGGIGMLVDRNAVHSALFLLLNFMAIAVLFLLLRAPFLAAIQVMVYAGAIMVLFVFVVMLLGDVRVEDSPNRLRWQSWLALGLGLVLLIEAFIVGGQAATGIPPLDTPERVALSRPEQIGLALFTDYLLPLEITGVLLLVAIVGVVVLQQRSRAQGWYGSLEEEEQPASRPNAEIK